jgi:hypothetical protein
MLDCSACDNNYVAVIQILLFYLSYFDIFIRLPSFRHFTRLSLIMCFDSVAVIVIAPFDRSWNKYPNGSVDS